jgi:ABC-type oligopeptide transport system substrate-binding subunit
MLSKRFVLGLVLLVICGLSAQPLFAQNSSVDVYGRPLPDDAAPYDMQIWRVICESTRTEISFSAVVSVYGRTCLDTNVSDLFSDSLVVLDENLNLIPAAAESWSVSEDGLTWTFILQDGLMWNDGTPVTANDYVASYRFMADPANAYDFVWMWQGIIDGWSEAVAGEIPPEEIGMVAVDDRTLAVTTEGPAPYLPGTLFFWPPLQAKALAEHGPNYLFNPETAVSAGPFKVTEFVPGERFTLTVNEDYTGYRKPYLREIRAVYGDQLNGSFLAFQNYDIERVNYANISPADFEIIAADPVLSANYRPTFGDFRTDYLLFDTYNPPFNDRRVRLAFAKALDRETIVRNVVGEQFAIPAYSFLAPGFPASDTEGALRDIQAYDCPAAQQLLAEAGYPGGAGFPPQELKLRGESEARANWFVAAAASISSCLGVQITVNNMEFSAYMSALLARPTQIQFGAVSYGMDYLDPSNMLGVWVSTGRHSWRNEAFDSLVREANVFVGDPAERIAMYQQAERILVEDVGGVFLLHRIQGDLFQPYVAGDCFRPDNQGVGAWHWGNDWCWGTFYITNDVMNYPTYRTR